MIPRPDKASDIDLPWEKWSRLIERVWLILNLEEGGKDEPEAAYRRGHWPSALDLAQAAETAGDVRAAYRYYAILFMVAEEKDQIYTRSLKGYTPHVPGFTHMAQADNRAPQPIIMAVRIPVLISHSPRPPPSEARRQRLRGLGDDSKQGWQFSPLFGVLSTRRVRRRRPRNSASSTNAEFVGANGSVFGLGDPV